MNQECIENGQFLDPKYQRALWDRQHAYRGENFGREDLLKNDPTQSARMFHDLMPRGAKIIEVGSGNGRDARFWALRGHSIVCIDFSEIALRQLSRTAREQGVIERITPIVYDINSGWLPFETGKNFDGFYARSALHVSDDTMISLTRAIDCQLKPGGKVLILGKSLCDEKIQRSERLENGLAIDHEEGGHVRRIWTPEFMKQMCEVVQWRLLSIDYSGEVINNRGSEYITMIAQKYE